MKRLIDRYSKSQIEIALVKSNSIKELLIHLNMKVNNGNYRNIKSLTNHYGLELPKYDNLSQVKSLRNIIRIPTEKFFVLGALRKGVELKSRLLKEFHFKNECSICSLPSVWNNKPLTLQIDHINGDRFDNRIENLRIICPNCHSQTDTFSNAGNIKRYNYCECGVRICKTSKKCHKCNVNTRTVKHKIQWPSIEFLLKELETKSRVKLAEELGVSDNAIKKHIKNGVRAQGGPLHLG